MPGSSTPAPWRRTLLVGHVAVAVGLVGATVVLVGLGVAGLRGADPRTVYPAAHMVDAWVIAPLVMLALVTGVVQTRITGRRLLAPGWVRTKFVITAAMAVVVSLVLEPRLAASARDALAGQSLSTSDFLPLVVAPAVATALLVLNVTLGIVKPEAAREGTGDDAALGSSSDRRVARRIEHRRRHRRAAG